MATAATFTKTGAKASKNAQLPKGVFDLKVESYDLIKLAYDAHEANGRQGSAQTKTRGLVRGGGRKPWRQKGTGNARAGSIRSPIWRGGGITFGPTGEENFTKKVNARAKAKAVKQALSVMAREKSVFVIEDVSVKDGKTKQLANLLAKLNLTRNTLIVVSERDEMLVRAAANIKQVTVINVDYLNVKRVVDADALLFTKDALARLEEKNGDSK